MIDTLLKNIQKLDKPKIWDSLGLKTKGYFVMTLHRPNNVDEEFILKSLTTQIINLATNFPVIFPVHPRTKTMLNSFNLKFPNLYCIKPLGYLHFNYLVRHAKGVITDSGGITEEATVMKVPCITLRNSTERPETCEIGTNILVGNDSTKIENAFHTLLNGKWKKGGIPELWDGNAAKRIINCLIDIYKLK